MVVDTYHADIIKEDSLERLPWSFSLEDRPCRVCDFIQIHFLFQILRERLISR